MMIMIIFQFIMINISAEGLNNFKKELVTTPDRAIRGTIQYKSVPS